MRYASIDLLRTVAIVLMVLVHFTGNLAGFEWRLAGFGAPLFNFLVGVSYRIWLNAQEAKGRSDTEISKVSIRRGLFLFWLGFAFNILVWLPEDTFNWDVLTLIGTSLLVLNFARNKPLFLSAFMAILAYVLGPVLREITVYPDYWVNGYFRGDLTLSDVFIGYFATGYFPLFPWIAYSLTGFVTASLLFAERREDRVSTLRVGLFGFAMITPALLALVFRTSLAEPIQKHVLKGWTMFPPSIEYVTCTLGVALFLFALGHRWIDGNAKLAKSKVVQWGTTFGKHSLSIYLLHHVIHLWPLWIYGIAMGKEPTQYWQKAMPVTVAAPLAVLFLVGCDFLFRWMDRTGRRGVEAWMRYLCD